MAGCKKTKVITYSGRPRGRADGEGMRRGWEEGQGGDRGGEEDY